MDTLFFNAISQPDNGTKLSGSVIRSGGLVAFPTETVYGLGANGLDGEAIGRIFEAKGRPLDNPIILHVARKSDVKPLWKGVPPVAQKLMDTFWPGPLTLVYLKSGVVPPEATAGLPTVAVRMPAHKTALALIRAANVPIAAPSANTSGKPSPTTAAHVRADMNGKIDIIIDGGPCRVGVESTVLSLIGTPTILRPGGITKEMLEAMIGEVRLDKSVLSPMDETEDAASPGMKHRHYAPDAELFVACGREREAARRICTEYERLEREGKRCVVFATTQTQGFYKGMHHVTMGDRNSPETLCANLFSALRAHSADADVILAEGINGDEMGLAYMNRLLRASGFKTL